MFIKEISVYAMLASFIALTSSCGDAPSTKAKTITFKGPVKYIAGQQQLSVNNLTIDNTSFEIVQVKSLMPDTIAIDKPYLAKIFLSSPFVKLVGAYKDCQVSDESLVDRASNIINHCNQLDGISNDTLTLSIIAGPTEGITTINITLLSMDLDSVYRYHHGSIQYFAKGPSPMPYLKKNGKYIYVEHGTMTPILTKEYDEADCFCGKEHATVKLGKSYGMINKEGKEIVPVKYDDVNWFSDGLAAVKLNGLYGYVNESGNEIVSPRYYFATSHVEGMAWVQLNGESFFIDNSGRPLEGSKSESDGYNPFNDGLAPIQKSGHKGFIDKTGKEVIPFLYDKAWEFSEGLAGVELDGKWGYINLQGDMIISPQFDYVESFRNGFAEVKNGELWGLINKKGMEVAQTKFQVVSNFEEGLAPVKIDDKYAFLNNLGDLVIPEKYDDTHYFSDGLVAVSMDLMWGFVDRQGKEIVPIKYYVVEPFKDGVAAVKDATRWGIIDRAGKEVVKPKYESMFYYQNGIWRAKLDGQIFYLDQAYREYRDQ